jgi:arsenate reductase
MADNTMQYYHNPRCSKSRQGLALLEEKGVSPEIVKYLDDVPTEAEFRKLLAKLDIAPEALVRKSEAYFKEKLKGLSLTDDEWIQVMLENPKLIERPIFVNGTKAIVGRPPENILDIL